MKTKRLLIVFFITIIIISAIFVLLVIKRGYFMLSSENTKYAQDYSVSDLIRARNIVLKYCYPDEEAIKKYDIDKDGKVTIVDVKLIQQMILRYYDSYEVRNKNHKAVKYIYD